MWGTARKAINKMTSAVLSCNFERDDVLIKELCNRLYIIIMFVAGVRAALNPLMGKKVQGYSSGWSLV